MAPFGLPHIWLVRFFFLQPKQCFSLTTIQPEQCFSASFSQVSDQRTGPYIYTYMHAYCYLGSIKEDSTVHGVNNESHLQSSHPPLTTNACIRRTLTRWENRGSRNAPCSSLQLWNKMCIGKKADATKGASFLVIGHQSHSPTYIYGLTLLHWSGYMAPPTILLLTC